MSELYFMTNSSSSYWLYKFKAEESLESNQFWKLFFKTLFNVLFNKVKTVDVTVSSVVKANTSNYKWHWYSQINFKQQNFNMKKKQFSLVLDLNNEPNLRTFGPKVCSQLKRRLWQVTVDIMKFITHTSHETFFHTTMLRRERLRAYLLNPLLSNTDLALLVQIPKVKSHQTYKYSFDIWEHFFLLQHRTID